MSMKKRPVSPTAGKKSTDKKVARVNAAEGAIGAVETKLFVAEPVVAKPETKKLTKVAEPEKKEEPKKRGRKKNSEKNVEVAAEPKKRGRKPKAQAAEAVAAEPKKRGRKPKAQAVVEAAPAPKATRGPRKIKELNVEVQFQGRSITPAQLEERVKEVYAQKGKKPSYIKTASFYVKPEEATVYYVVNGDETGSFGI